MPSPQEFTILVDQNTLAFISCIIRIFLGLVMVLAFMFSFVIAVMYCSGKLLIFGYSVMLHLTSKASVVAHNARKMR